MKLDPRPACPACGVKIPAGCEMCPVCALRAVLGKAYDTVELNIDPIPSLPAFRFNHYELVAQEDGTPRELGRGAMGVTYKAVDVNLRSVVALKVINSRFIGDESAQRRFLREARAAASVRHPNVASVFHLGKSGDSCFYAMEFVEGETLDHLIGRSGRLEVKLALEITAQVAAGLDAVYKQKLVHRDIKPSNIMVSIEEGGAVIAKIIDLGLAKPTPDTSTESAISIAGTFAGTPEFASPEQFAGVGVDIRSDLYSVGVTLWQMLTEQTPFRGTPAELMYRHLHAPLPIRELDDLPQPIVALIEILLEKDPTRRFQTPAELLKAIPKVTNAIFEGLTITHRGLHDAPADFSEFVTRKRKLYGRDAERELLFRAFDRVAVSGLSELVLISGYSGIGKSSVVSELQKLVSLPRGIFISGSLDPHAREIPYASLAQAFQGLVVQILSESQEQVARWREAILQAIGTNGQLLVKLVPELEILIGKQPPVLEVAPQDAQNRFQLVLQRFLGVFAEPKHPAVLFLDNLHWLDIATLEFVEYLMSTPEVRYLLLIGAYRSNEVSPTHPLMRSIDAIRNTGAKIHEILLSPLALDDVGALVADSLHCNQESARALVELVHEKTAGNPFFVIQFLTRLAEERLLVFDSAAGTWNWDLARIGAQGYTDNIVDLVAGKLSRLPTKTQQALGQLACLGNSADIAILTLIQNESEEQLHATLWEAVRTGFVLRLEHAYAFVHDRVQETAYDVIAEGERASVHLRIGRLLLVKPEEVEKNIFQIVNQLNRASGLIDSLDEREQLAELNLVAAKRAQASTAYASALTYLIAGSSLLGEDCWDRRYALTFSFEFQRAECEFLSGDLHAAQERLSILSCQTANLVDSAVVARLQTELYGSLNQNDRAVSAALEYLRRAGIDWSAHPTDMEVRQEYGRIWFQLGSRRIEELVDLPAMTDPACKATLDVLTALEEPAYFTDQNLRCLVVVQMVNLSLEWGNSDGSCVAYVQLGWFVGPRFGDYEASFRFGKLGLDLVEKRGFERFRARVYQCFGYFINPWSRPIQTTVELLRRSFSIARETGDLKYAVYSCDRLITILLAAGDPLGDVQREAENGLEFARKANFGFLVDIIVGQLQFTRALRGLTVGLSSFDDSGFDESRFEQHLKANPDPVFASRWHWIRKLQVGFCAGDYELALDAAAKAEPLLLTGPRHPESVEYYFYLALVLATKYDTSSLEDNIQLRQELARCNQQVAALAEVCPENFRCRAALVGAEIARIEGRELDAECLYEKAIQSARENSFIHIEAVVHEVAARFYAGRGLQTISHAYLRRARSCYFRWGALGKVRQLEQSYSYLQEERTAA